MLSMAINLALFTTFVHCCALAVEFWYQTSITENPVLRSKLSLPLRTHIDAVKAFDDMIQRQVLDAGPSEFAKINLKSMRASGLKTLESDYAMYDVTIGVLDDLLVTRIGNFNQRRTYSLGIVSISIVLAALFVISIERSISGPIAELKEATDRINKGDLSTTPNMDRRDEIGQLAGAIGRLQKTLQGSGKMKAAA